tara:strand:+ start:845 stop:5698 length:4854 start_codon:yes stop_codon:yes gene_type:complete
MPSINVAKTDTFENQRQKINQIGDQIFSISQGGSDLSTGILKIGDGTKPLPSLAFTTDSSLGIYKPSQGALGFVHNSKDLFNISNDSLNSFRNILLTRKLIETSGVSINAPGQNYDDGTFANIPLNGGSGTGAQAEFVVTKFTGTITTTGDNYVPGQYSSVSLSGGNGSGAIVDFNIPSIGGVVSVPGAGYIPGSYTAVPLTPTTGSGAGAIGTIDITGDAFILGTISAPGSGYETNSYQAVTLLNTPTTTYTVTSTTNLGTPPPANVYQINGVTQQALTLIKGNSYTFDVSDASNDTHPFVFQTTQGGTLGENYSVITKGTPGTANATVQLIIKPSAPNESIKYNCTAHDGMGAAVTITTGTAGSYGSGATANITVDSGGAITGVSNVTLGSGYQVGDVLSASQRDIGGQSFGGSGFQWTVSSFDYQGTINQVVITDSGTNYQLNNILEINNADVGGAGAGFQYTISTTPGKVTELLFSDKGTGYQVSDVLTLPAAVSTSGELKGTVGPLSTTLSDASATITVTSTTGIVAGMIVFGGQTDTGALAGNTTVASVDNATEITLSDIPTVAGAASLTFESAGNLAEVVVGSKNGLLIGAVVTVTSGTGTLAANTKILSIDSNSNIIVLDKNPTQAGSATLSFAPPYGSGTASFQYTIDALGVVESVDITSGGNGYAVGDDLNVISTDLVNPIVYPVVNVDGYTHTFVSAPASSAFAAGDQLEKSDGTSQSGIAVVKTTLNGGNIIEADLEGTFQTGDVLRKVGTTSPTFEVNTVAADADYFYKLDVGSGYTLQPSFTFYVGNTYQFDLSDPTNSTHTFALSSFPEGRWGQSLIENITASLLTSNKQITVSSTTGIVAGMVVEAVSGTGTVDQSTVVESVDSGTTLTLSVNPTASGTAVLKFYGAEYTDGVTRTATTLTIKVTATTPTPLYYYCSTPDDSHTGEGGSSSITIDANNPKTFGTGFILDVNAVSSSNTVSTNVLTGEVSSATVNATTSITTTQGNITNISADNTTTTNLVVEQIDSSTNLELTALSLNVNNPLNVGANLQISNTNGNITTTGVVKSTGTFSSSDVLQIELAEISSIGANDLTIAPAGGRIAKVSGTTALVLPVGDTLERPQSPIAQNGAIRFNTDNNQYEGYNSTTTSWSSLGGVRDIDGNTYILAELTAGANDNILWFYNDAVNTLKLTPNSLDFTGVKTISSTKLGLPTYVEWTANTPVTLGQYIKYRNNLYEVTGAGSTATSGGEPTHTTGALNNGTSQLTWSQKAVSSITFDNAEEVRIGPFKNCPLIIGSELKLHDNRISTTVQDLIIEPNAGKQTIVLSNTHFRIPAGTDNEKQIAAAGPGSIRFNTDIQQFEGYSGTNWSSLGGVRDVDGNTYIIPETAPGQNENILYFYNNNKNTLQLSESELDFTNIDTITTSGGTSLALDTATLTLNTNDTTIDNTDSTRTFISSTKQYFDLGLSSGLNTDPILRLDDQGDVYLNTTFGSGSFNGVKIFDGDLKEFELADYKLKTSTFTLDKGGLESSAVVLYDSSTSKGCKVTVVSKSDSGKRSMAEFSVIDNGTDIFYSEYAALNTSADGFAASFDFTASTEPRITLTLTDNHTVADIIQFTVLIQEIK